MKSPLLFCAALLLAPAVVGQTLLHYYDFNSGSVTDLAGSANGTLNNGAAISGGSLILDGINDTATFATKIVPISGAFTVAFFAIGPTSLSGIHEMISQGSSGGPGFYIGYADSSFRLGDSWPTTGIAFPTDGLEHHFALTFDGSGTAKFYIDGSLLGTQGSFSIGASGTDTTLGAQFGPHGEYFAGSIDELRVYSSALTLSQVQAVMAIPEPATTSALAAAAALAFVSLRRRRFARLSTLNSQLSLHP